MQGVNYRNRARQQALRLNLTGWVKNLEDGTVRLCAEGEERNLKEMLNWCKIGSRPAKVNQIEQEWSDLKRRQYLDFTVSY